MATIKKLKKYIQDDITLLSNEQKNLNKTFKVKGGKEYSSYYLGARKGTLKQILGMIEKKIPIPEITDW